MQFDDGAGNFPSACSNNVVQSPTPACRIPRRRVSDGTEPTWSPVTETNGDFSSSNATRGTVGTKSKVYVIFATRS